MAFGCFGPSLLVDGILARRFFQLDGDFFGWLAHIKVLSGGAEPRRDHLDAHCSIRNAVDFGLAVLVGLQFPARVLLLSLFIQGMHDDLRVAYRLAVLVFDDRELERSGGSGLLGPGQSGDRREQQEQDQSSGAIHGDYSTGKALFIPSEIQPWARLAERLKSYNGGIMLFSAPSI